THSAHHINPAIAQAVGTRVSTHWPLALLLITFLSLATLYNVVNPIFEAPDEPWHYLFVDHLANGRGLPILYADPLKNIAGQEGGQPPLYYALAALTVFWTDRSDLSAIMVRNPREGEGPGPNFLTHTAREDFPYQGAVLGVHVVRALSSLMGAVTVLLTYLIALEVFGDKRRPAMLAAGFVALNPQFLFVAASVSNDNLVATLSALALLLILRGWRRGFSLAGAVILGAVLAAASLAKLSGLALLPLAMAGFGLRACRGGFETRPYRPLAFCLAAFAIVVVGAGWWFIRNLALYGDITALRLFIAASGAQAHSIDTNYFLGEMGQVWLSFWAFFGWMNVPAGEYYYWFYGAVTIAAVVGLLSLALKNNFRMGRREEGRNSAVAFLLAAWVGVFLVLLVLYMGIATRLQGRLLFPALPAISVALVAGLYRLTSNWHVGARHASPLLPAALGSAMLVLAVLAPLVYIGPAYPRFKLLDEGEARAIPDRLDVTFGGTIQLLGYRLERRGFLPGESLEITLYWRAAAPPGADYTVFLHAFDAWGNRLGQVDEPLGRNGYPSAAWLAGVAIQESYILQIQEPRERPSLVRIDTGLYRLSDMGTLAATDSQGRPLGTVITAARIKAAALSPPATPSAVGTSLGTKVLLLGYQRDVTGVDGTAGFPNSALRPPVPARDDENIQPGETLAGRLWWKALGDITKDYTVFVQLVGPGGLAAKYDAQPRGNTYPTSLWEAGEIVEDHFRLTVPERAETGVYRLIAGMYDVATGARLGDRESDAVQLGRLMVP
ncbi:MAG: DUF2142 domain-containing protein, partial [Dehalococcoidia bacterium]|nr:DUF2142 domain-containing protein [Dehalococcoidia bacterium]